MTLYEKNPQSHHPSSRSRNDVGEQLGFIETTIDFALDRADLSDEVKKLILQKAAGIQQNTILLKN